MNPEPSSREASALKWVGKRLGRDLFKPNGVLILNASHRLSPDDLSRLAEHGIVLSEQDIEKPKHESEILRALEQSVSQMEDIFKNIRLKGQIPLLEIRNEVLPAIYESTENVRVFPLLLSLQAKDEYTYRHNVAVGAISSMLGRWLGLPENELAVLTVGALLHDVGKMRVPESILNKKGKLTDEEYDIMKKHTIYGYEMLQSCVGLSRRSALIALQHHERDDGTGYPLRIASDKIDYLSKIVSVADVFHALSSNRVYRAASPFYEILHRMYTGTLGPFDRAILRTFTRRLMNALVGSEVELTDGRVGKVVLINPVDPTRPLIQIGRQFLDLSREPGIRMEQIVG
ncbi:HD-GYP domain-containing protein [Cohnella faecalis]|nr:HD-GYP domain-containing protein [Cohnella faecalis]